MILSHSRGLKRLFWTEVIQYLAWTFKVFLDLWEKPILRESTIFPPTVPLDPVSRHTPVSPILRYLKMKLLNIYFTLLISRNFTILLYYFTIPLLYPPKTPILTRIARAWSRLVT
ncbi:hypothetical protein OUZ56_025470 [Daphnia magna]|uniref:Uncharacterized protein n=1 Tax=Daphnia magna TaxID=35525 RepID=A0ABQ9ZJY9_9CRUS|nr:hypothetical protein OUZ56_025470 [Daphnia magna]